MLGHAINNLGEAKIRIQGLVLHLCMGCEGSSLLLTYNAGCTLVSLESTTQSEHRIEIKARSWGEVLCRNFCLSPFFLHNHSAKNTTPSQLSCDAEMCYLYMTLKCTLKMPQGRGYGRLRAPVTDVFVSCEHLIQMHGVLDSKTLILRKPKP